MKKGLAVLVCVVLVGAGGYYALRYTQRVSERLSGAPGAGGGPAKISFIKDPATIPDLTMRTLDGRTLTNEDLAGKVTLVNFWATWCPPCRDEIPDLIKLQEQYKDRLLVIGVSSDEGPTEMVSRFAADYRINYPIVMETEELALAFTGIYALPTTFVVDPELRMVKKHVGRVNAAMIELETRALLKMPVDAVIEHVAESSPSTLSNTAQATEVPGLKLETLTPDQRTAALKRLNQEACPCGCGLTLAQCRINDSSCTVSLPIAEKIVQELRGTN